MIIFCATSNGLLKTKALVNKISFSGEGLIENTGLS